MSLLDELASVKDSPGPGKDKTGQRQGGQNVRGGMPGAFNIQLDNLTILHVYDSISLCRELVVVGHNDKGRTASLV